MSKHGSSILFLIILISSTMGSEVAVSNSVNFEIKQIKNGNELDFQPSIIEETYTIQAFESFGNQEEFWTANLQTNEWFLVRATLLAVGENCYIYMDNRTIVSMGQSQAIERCEILSSEFDRVVYPKNYELMGNPNGTLGDIDGDPHITVFLVEGVGSYYLQHNELTGYPYSNSREMVFVSSEMQLINTIAVMCHETNHLFLFNYDLDEAVFLIEGLAEFSMYYAGYMSNSSFMQGGMTLNVTMSAYYFSINPSVSMFYFDKNYYSYSSYGVSYIFWFYIAEKYGIQIIKDLISIDELDGPEGIEYVLSNHGYNISFNEVFLDFITACAIDQTGIYGDLYGFLNADYQISTKTVYNLPSVASDIEHRYYCVDIKEIHEVPDEFSIEIETPASPCSLGVVIIIHDENGWNVTQTILTGDSSSKRLFCTGNNIEEVFLVTSIIKEGTPNAPLIWMSSPINTLDFSFLEGHVNPTIAETSSLFLSLLPILLIMVICERKRKLRSN